MFVIVTSVTFTLIIFILYSMGLDFEFSMPIAAIGAAFVWVLVNKNMQEAEEKRRKESDEEARRFKSGEMKGREREEYCKKQMSKAEKYYNHGDLSMLEYAKLEKIYTGKSVILDNLGYAATAAASEKLQVERAIAKQEKDAQNSMIFSAAVGGAIGGTAGAVIGAATSAQRDAEKRARLEQQRVAIEKEYRQALEDSVKNRLSN